MLLRRAAMNNQGETGGVAELRLCHRNGQKEADCRNIRRHNQGLERDSMGKMKENT